MAKKKKIDKASKPASYATEEFASNLFSARLTKAEKERHRKRNNIICFKIADKELWIANPKSSFCFCKTLRRLLIWQFN